MTSGITLANINQDEFPELLRVWEASVRATHHFLAEHDIIFFKNTIQSNNLFAQVDLTVARNDHRHILGFLGVSADTIEMLFIDPAVRNNGIGRRLLDHALSLGIQNVDVNEQNQQAVGFYKHFGFVTVSRSPIDATGKPYPILHMQRNLTAGE